MSGQTQAPSTVPTAPGRWWGSPKLGDAEPQVVQVIRSEYSGDLVAAGLAQFGVWLEDITWLAPVPDIDRCAALASAATRRRGCCGRLGGTCGQQWSVARSRLMG